MSMRLYLILLLIINRALPSFNRRPRGHQKSQVFHPSQVHQGEFSQYLVISKHRAIRVIHLHVRAKAHRSSHGNNFVFQTEMHFFLFSCLSRIYVGSQLCNLINPQTRTLSVNEKQTAITEKDQHFFSFSYAPVTNTTLQCRIEGDEVGESFSSLVFLSSSYRPLGLFNVTIIVTNGYGRSKVDEYLIRISSTGQRYSVETYSSKVLLVDDIEFTLHNIFV